jgi:hypothetical protein
MLASCEWVRQVHQNADKEIKVNSMYVEFEQR